jgi:hypothetical protein
MFETRPNFEQPVPLPIAMEGSRYWRAMVLTVNLPWYLLRHRLATAEGGITQTVAIAWESTLRSALEGGDERSVIDLHIIAPTGESGDWTMRRVAEVWLPSPEEMQDTGPLLFRLHGDASLLSSYLTPASSAPSKRTLLSSFA